MKTCEPQSSNSGSKSLLSVLTHCISEYWKLKGEAPVKNRSKHPLSRAPLTPPLTGCTECLLAAKCSLPINHDPSSKVWTLTFSAASRPSDRWRQSFVSSHQIIHFTHTHTQMHTWCLHEAESWDAHRITHSNSRLVAGWYFDGRMQRGALWQSLCFSDNKLSEIDFVHCHAYQNDSGATLLIEKAAIILETENRVAHAEEVCCIISKMLRLKDTD